MSASNLGQQERQQLGVKVASQLLVVRERLVGRHRARRFDADRRHERQLAQMKVVRERVDVQQVLEPNALLDEPMHQLSVIERVHLGSKVRQRVHVGAHEHVRDANLEEHHAAQEVLAHVHHLAFLLVIIGGGGGVGVLHLGLDLVDVRHQAATAAHASRSFIQLVRKLGTLVASRRTTRRRHGIEIASGTTARERKLFRQQATTAAVRDLRRAAHGHGRR